MSPRPSFPVQDLSNFSYEKQNSIPFDQVLSNEKELSLSKKNRSKSIIMLNYTHKKERYDLDKSIDKKIEKAEKNQTKFIKDRVKGIKQMNEKLEIMKRQREQDKKMEMRETINLIKEMRQKDISDQKKVDSIREREQKKISDYLDGLREKREKVLKFKEDEFNSFENNLPNELEDFNGNMSRVDQNRYESSAEKVNKLKKRNRYVEEKHNEMN